MSPAGIVIVVVLVAAVVGLMLAPSASTRRSCRCGRESDPSVLDWPETTVEREERERRAAAECRVRRRRRVTALAFWLGVAAAAGAVSTIGVDIVADALTSRAAFAAYVAAGLCAIALLERRYRRRVRSGWFAAARPASS